MTKQRLLSLVEAKDARAQMHDNAAALAAMTNPRLSTPEFVAASTRLSKALTALYVACDTVEALLPVVIEAIAMRGVHEGCVTTPACGSCTRCRFDAAVDKLVGERILG